MRAERSQEGHKWDDALEQRGRNALLRSKDLIAMTKKLITQAKRLKDDIEGSQLRSR